MYNELQKRIADPIEMSKVGEVFSLKVRIKITQWYNREYTNEYK